MVFNTTFNNISVISWLSVLLVKETGVHGDNHRPMTEYQVIYRQKQPKGFFMSLKELLPFLTNISSYILMRVYQDLHIVTVVCGTVFEGVIALYELECFFKQHFVERHLFLFQI